MLEMLAVAFTDFFPRLPPLFWGVLLSLVFVLDFVRETLSYEIDD